MEGAPQYLVCREQRCSEAPNSVQNSLCDTQLSDPQCQTDEPKKLKSVLLKLYISVWRLSAVISLHTWKGEVRELRAGDYPGL